MKKLKTFIQDNIGKPCEKVMAFLKDNAYKAKYTAMKVGATAVGIAGFSNVMGQEVRPHAPDVTTVLQTNTLSSNVHVGAHGRASVVLGRFEPFAQANIRTQLFSERNKWAGAMTARNHEVWSYEEGTGWTSREVWIHTRLDTAIFNVERFTNAFILNFGTYFKITDKNFLRFAVNFDRGQARSTNMQIGFNRREQLSPRTTIDLYTYYTRGLLHLNGGRRRWYRQEMDSRGNISKEFGGDIVAAAPAMHGLNIFGVGTTLKHQISPTLQLALDLSLKHRAPGNPEARDMIARNILNVSAGVHWRIPTDGQLPEFTPRERAPRAPRVRKVRRTAPRGMWNCPAQQPRQWGTETERFIRNSQNRNR